MKIALITIHKVSNYGALLQAYATKVVLSKYGEVSTIDYNNGLLNKELKLIRFEASVHGIKKTIHDVLRLPFYKLITRFKRFIRHNMNLTQELNAEDLNNSKLDNFDVYVCGSDQIWNPYIISFNEQIDPIFFLSFAPDNAVKFSYASSIGHYNFNNKEKSYVKELLTGFKSISVREKDGVEKIQNIFPDRKIKHVVDPTLLLSKNEWLKEFKLTKHTPKEKYLLVYSVPRTELIKKAVQYFAKKLNLKIVSIDKMLIPLMKVDKHVRDAGPKEYIELFANASFIITDSFHGTCFSVNFNKPFVSISLGKRTNRIASLLSLLDLKNRIMYNEDNFKSVITDIDYNIVEQKLQLLREYSLNYIKDAFEK